MMLILKYKNWNGKINLGGIMSNQDNGNGNVVEKIRKLLALAADDPDSNESKLAAARAEQLMTKYEIESIGAEVDSGAEGIDKETIKMYNTSSRVKTVEGMMRYNRDNWEVKLATILCDLADCKIVMYPHGIQFIGYKKDLELTIWYYKLIRLKIHKNIDKYYGYVKAHNNSDEIYSYTLGYLTSLDKIIRKMHETKRNTMENNCKDLVVAKDAQINKYMKELFPDMRRTKIKNDHSKLRYEDFKRGELDGQQHTFNTPVE